MECQSIGLSHVINQDSRLQKVGVLTFWRVNPPIPADPRSTKSSSWSRHDCGRRLFWPSDCFQRVTLPASKMWRILNIFCPECIFKRFYQKSVCITYKRSLVELLKGMTKSKQFSKLRWRAGGIYFPIMDLPSPPPVMLKPYNSHPPSHMLSIICAPTVLPTPTGTH